MITDNDEMIMKERPEVSEQASDSDILIEDAEQEDTAVEEVTIEEPELNTALEINDSNAWDGITTEKTYEQDQISYIFTVKKTWKGGFNGSVRINNNGDDTIENWALRMNYPVDITNLWNATIEDNADGKYTIKNAAWNSDIKPGRSVEYGFTVRGDFEKFPESFEMLGVESEQDKQGYTIEYFVDNEWKSGFTGRIVITNTSDSPIEDWTLSFTYDREIRSIWSATIESHEGNRYVIKNKSYNANIKSGESVSFGFNGKGGTSDNEPTEYMLESISFNTIVVSEEENDTPSFDEKIEEVMSRYDESNYDLDTDNDGMKDCEEEIIGTDLNAEDTDGDSLTDHEEVYMTWTDPLIADSVISGISDAEADSDNDGIINKEEIKLGMDPRSSDTDEDGLSDHDEINALILDLDRMVKDPDDRDYLYLKKKLIAVLERSFSYKNPDTSRYSRFSTEDKEKMYEMYLKGSTYKKIAEEFSCSVSYVSKIMDDMIYKKRRALWSFIFGLDNEVH